MSSPPGPSESPLGNDLLAAFPVEDLQQWGARLELVDLSLGQVLCEPGAEFEYAYFPLTSIVTLIYVMLNGETAEIALVGRDGILGVALCLGGNTTMNRAVVQNAGKGYRLPAGDLAATVARGGVTQRVLLLYAQSLLTQMTQSAACNKHHTLKQQFSRWLLLSFDRLVGDMVMTQKLIAQMLGVGGDAVLTTATALAATGAIDYEDGRMTLRDRDLLERSSCECYAKVREECSRLSPMADGRLLESAAAV